MSPLRIGILGGGQLGRLLVEARPSVARPLALRALTLRADDPISRAGAEVVVGDVHVADDVVAFGRDLDVVTVEREDVSAEGLRALAAAGVDVLPSPEAVATIQDKGTQKEAMVAHGHPTSPFALYPDAAALRAAVDRGERPFPFVQKARRMGFDGRGVQVVRGPDDLDQLFDVACLAEDAVDIAHEIAVIVARDRAGGVVLYDPVEMVFHPEHNLLEWLVCPARIDAGLAREARRLAERVAVDFGVVGLLAVELFVARDGALLINEMAPRPHNSGHHTIEGNVTSQYANHLRILAGESLGSPALRRPSILVNLLGSPGARGTPVVRGMDRWAGRDDVFVHLYGKQVVRPFRKMGHATVVADDLDAAFVLAEEVRASVVIDGAG